MNPLYITRALEPIVLECSRHFKVVAVTGPRQVGKTTMLKHLAAQQGASGMDYSYVSLDDTEICILAKESPRLFFQRYKAPLIIDEIQKAPELLPFIKEMVDASDEKGLFWITGSQPFHLMKEISESLAGRVCVLEMLGLSGAELSGMSSVPFIPGGSFFIDRVKEATELESSAVFGRIAAGSLPGIATLPVSMRATAYESYLDTYIMRDVRDLAQVGDELRFRRFITACAALTSKPVVYAELARVADINERTAKTWLSLLVSSYLVKIIPAYSNNLIKRLNKQPILHFTDTGLAAHLAGWDDAKTLELGAMSGKLFETYVFGELYKSFSNCGKVAPLSFFRTNDRKEIDLVLERNGVLYPIEVKQGASPRDAATKNFNALDVLDAGTVSPELVGFKREIGTGAVVCTANETYPINSRAWAFPVWAI